MLPSQTNSAPVAIICTTRINRFFQKKKEKAFLLSSVPHYFASAFFFQLFWQNSYKDLQIVSQKSHLFPKLVYTNNEK
jgi:hypothetical protein